jgi:hypothetical protein
MAQSGGDYMDISLGRQPVFLARIARNCRELAGNPDHIEVVAELATAYGGNR